MLAVMRTDEDALNRTRPEDLELLRACWPNKNDRELAEIAQFLREYLRVALEIYKETRLRDSFDNAGHSPYDKETKVDSPTIK